MIDVDVQQRVMKVMSDVLNKTENEIQLSTSLREDLQLDSLLQMTLFIALEDEFQLTIPPEEVTELVTVKDIIDFIHKKTHETSAA